MCGILARRPPPAATSCRPFLGMMIGLAELLNLREAAMDNATGGTPNCCRSEGQVSVRLQGNLGGHLTGHFNEKE